MKKIFFSLLAIGAIASCAKTEATYVEVDSEIKLAPVASIVTKANGYDTIIDGTKYPEAEHFTVVGYWANQPAGSLFEERCGPGDVQPSQNGSRTYTKGP